MALPEGFLEDLKFRNPIEDVISSYVSRDTRLLLLRLRCGR